MDLAALIIAVVALMAAVPPLLQMICGRPAFDVRFEESTEPEPTGRALICAITNRPITNRLLRALGVTRSEARVFASFDIKEHGTKAIKASAYRAYFTDVTNIRETGLSLMARPPLPVAFIMAFHNAKGAHIRNHPKGSDLILAPGEYYAEIKIGWADSARFCAHSFTVAEVKEGTHWTFREIP